MSDRTARTSMKQIFVGYDQFIIWKLVPDPGKKPKKVPVHPVTLAATDPHDPTNWMSQKSAILLAGMHGDEYGIGFVFTADDPFWFLDIDGQLDTPIAKELLQMFSGCAIEISQSGNGYHIFGSGDCPPHGTRCRKHNLELYTEKRFVALTGNWFDLNGDETTDRSRSLPWLVMTYFPVGSGSNPVSTEWTTGPVPEWSGPTDDEVLINKALTSGGAVFGSSPFKNLWEANEQALGERYPDPNNPWGYSEADAGLAQHLAFWTGKDCERIDRLMRQSALYRDKWDRRESPPGYLKTTILKTCALCTDVYSASALSLGTPPRDADEAEAPPSDSVDTKSGLQYLTPENQKEHFKGCTYIQSSHRIWTPDGLFHRPEQFRSMYGGYLFALDSMNEKTTRSSWEAFTESQAVHFPKVTTACFRPLLPSGTIIHEEGRKLINVHVPIETEQKPGDPARFLEFMEKLLPNSRDREILISYMASLVQNPGVKFQWWPFIQGTEGNGKTILTRILEFAVGKRYTHLPNAADLSGNGLKFTAWIDCMLLIVIEEIFVSDRHNLMESLKPLITNPRIEIQGKGVNQITGDNMVNGLTMSNHKDGQRITLDSRRYAPFYTAQQCREDLMRDGMTERYFYDLYNWLRDEGYAITNHYLHNYQIRDEFNPATLCQRAPNTSSTQEAVTLSLGAIEQEVQEAIDEGRAGFAGGWVSSKMLDKLLDQIHALAKIPPRKRRALLQSLGYDWHPALEATSGRVNNPIILEGGKPKLFAKIGHTNNNLTTPPAVVKAYMQAQGYVSPADAKVRTG